jgi:hypothetical protein
MAAILAGSADHDCPNEKPRFITPGPLVFQLVLLPEIENSITQSQKFVEPQRRATDLDRRADKALDSFSGSVQYLLATPSETLFPCSIYHGHRASHKDFGNLLMVTPCGFVLQCLQQPGPVPAVRRSPAAP